MDAKTVFPESPYLGLAQYSAEESILYAGRESHVDACKGLLAQVQTRLLLLHGQTGCGKSSFLRAGLIPALEELGFGYAFLRRYDDETDTTGKPIFIRSGHDPVTNLAREIYEYVARPRVLDTALGKREFDLSVALRGSKSAEEFIANSNDPLWLIRALEALAPVLPATLVIVLDQAEEVLTLNAPDSPLRTRFFEFLKLFNVLKLTTKLILSLRKDYSGEFIGLSQIGSNVQADFKMYLLPEMTQEEVLHAVLLPTSEIAIPGAGSPRAHYKFKFGPGVAENIVDDLFQAIPGGAILPVVQILCKELFERVCKQEGEKIIDERLYNKDSLKRCIKDHVSKSLRESFGTAGWGERDMADEERRWRKVLYRLVRIEGDGRVHTDVMSKASFSDYANQERVRSNSNSVFDRLTLPNVLVLRRFAIPSAGRQIDEPMCSLGHDVIGLSLVDSRRDDESLERAERRVHRIKRYVAIAVGVSVAVAAVAIIFGYQNARDDVEKLHKVSAEELRHETGTALGAAIRAYELASSPLFFNRGLEQQARSDLERIVAALPDYRLKLPISIDGGAAVERRDSLLASAPGIVSVLSGEGVSISTIVKGELETQAIAHSVPSIGPLTSLSTAEPFRDGFVMLLTTFGGQSDVDSKFKLMLVEDGELVGPFGPAAWMSNFGPPASEAEAPIDKSTEIGEATYVSLTEDSVLLTTTYSDGHQALRPLVTHDGGKGAPFSLGAEIPLIVPRPTYCVTLPRREIQPSPQQFVVGATVFYADFLKGPIEMCPGTPTLEAIRKTPLQLDDSSSTWVRRVADIPLLTECTKPGRTCTYGFTGRNRIAIVEVAPFVIPQSSLGASAESYSTFKNSTGKSYVIFSSDGESSRVISNKVLQQQRNGCIRGLQDDGEQQSINERAGDGTQSAGSGNGESALKFIDGTPEDLVFGFDEGSAVEVVRIKSSGSADDCSVRVSLSGEIRQWRFSPAFNLLLAFSDTEFMAWDLSRARDVKGLDGASLLERARYEASGRTAD